MADENNPVVIDMRDDINKMIIFAELKEWMLKFKYAKCRDGIDSEFCKTCPFNMKIQNSGQLCAMLCSIYNALD